MAGSDLLAGFDRGYQASSDVAQIFQKRKQREDAQKQKQAFMAAQKENPHATVRVLAAKQLQEAHEAGGPEDIARAMGKLANASAQEFEWNRAKMTEVLDQTNEYSMKFAGDYLQQAMSTRQALFTGMNELAGSLAEAREAEDADRLRDATFGSEVRKAEAGAEEAEATAGLREAQAAGAAEDVRQGGWRNWTERQEFQQKKAGELPSILKRISAEVTDIYERTGSRGQAESLKAAMLEGTGIDPDTLNLDEVLERARGLEEADKKRLQQMEAAYDRVAKRKGPDSKEARLLERRITAIHEETDEALLERELMAELEEDDQTGKARAIRFNQWLSDKLGGVSPTQAWDFVKTMLSGERAEADLSAGRAEAGEQFRSERNR